MSKTATEKWIEAAAILARDPTARVRCPARDDAELVVFDIPFEAQPEMMERYLECPVCKARNAIRMRSPGR